MVKKNNFQNNIEWVNNSNIKIDNCNMKLSNFTGNRGILRSNSSNLTIQNSKLEIEKYLYNQVWVESNVCDCYTLIMRNNNIFISNAASILFKVNPLAKEQFLIINNDFITTDNTGAYTTVELLNESTTEDGYTTDSVTFCHAENAKYNFYASNNRINHQIIDSVNSFKEEQ